MIGAKATTGSGMNAVLRRGPIERTIRRFGEFAARTRAEQLARMTWTVEARHEPADPARHVREAAMTPLRWGRLA